jgi:hypothetical protein
MRCYIRNLSSGGASSTATGAEIDDEGRRPVDALPVNTDGTTATRFVEMEQNGSTLTGHFKGLFRRSCNGVTLLGEHQGIIAIRRFEA